MRKDDIAIITIIIAMLIHMLTPHAHADTIVTFKPQESSRFFRATIRKANKKLKRWPVAIRLRRSETPALLVNRSKDGWTRGQARICSLVPSSGYVEMTDYNEFGEDRRKQAVGVILHEVGHLAGAEHDDTAYLGGYSLMWRGVLALIGAKPFRLSEKSKQEILGCLG